MINNSVLSSSMNVAELAPKAASRLPERSGENAFSEAMAGAHSVHDRRESQAATNSRRDWAQGDRSVDRTRGQDRAAEVRADGSTSTDRTDRTDAPGRDAHAADAADGGQDAADATTATDDTRPTAEADDAASTQAPADAEAATPAATSAAAQATVAVAAAPVVTDLDAIIVPTSTTVTNIASDAIDAAMRLAIDAVAAATAPVDADATLTTTATAPTTAAAVDASVDAELVAVASGAEDADAGDVNAGPTRPTTSVTASTSGPSPTQLAAATFATDETAAPVATTAQVTQQVAVAETVDVAAGTTIAATQVVQAAAAEADVDVDGAPVQATLDGELVTDADAATTTAKATKVDAIAVAGAQADLEVVTDAEPEAVQAARLAQTQAPTVAINAQVQAQAQAKVAEQVVEEGSDAAPAKVEPTVSSLSSLQATARPDQAAAGVRVREGFQSAELQQRIDDIASQLATRLRLSQAAGGSQVQLSLKPRELGEVTVQMNVREGAVAATILVDKADTLRSLQTNIEELKRSLENQGLTIGEFSVDVRGDSGAGGANARAAADLRGDNRSATGAAASAIAGASATAPGLSGDREVAPEDVHDGDVSLLA